MIVRIVGINEELNVSSGTSLLNIHNKVLYRSIINYMYYFMDDEFRNDIVFIDENENRIKSNKITYIHDVISYKFDSKLVTEKLIKPFVISNISADIKYKEYEQCLYQKLIEPVLEFANSLDVEYEFKEELDQNFYIKLIGFDYSINDNQFVAEKIIAIIRLSIRLFKSQIIIMNRTFILLEEKELQSINEFCIKNEVVLLFIDYVDDSEVVIANNLTISPDFGAYKLK